LTVIASKSTALARKRHSAVGAGAGVFAALREQVRLAELDDAG
jgi:hypothetical protein